MTSQDGVMVRTVMTGRLLGDESLWGIVLFTGCNKGTVNLISSTLDLVRS